MFLWIIIVVFILLVIVFEVFSNVVEDVVIFICDDVYDDYSCFLNGCKFIEVKDFSGVYICCDVVDMIIV